MMLWGLTNADCCMGASSREGPSRPSASAMVTPLPQWGGAGGKEALLEGRQGAAPLQVVLCAGSRPWAGTAGAAPVCASPWQAAHAHPRLVMPWLYQPSSLACAALMLLLLAPLLVVLAAAPAPEPAAAAAAAAGFLVGAAARVLNCGVSRRRAEPAGRRGWAAGAVVNGSAEPGTCSACGAAAPFRSVLGII